MRTIAISVIFLALYTLFPVSAFAAIPSYTDTLYDVEALAKMTVNPELHRPTTLRLKGHVIIRNFRVGDSDSDGLPDIQTEIISMDLAGTTPQGLAVNLNSSKSNRSIGKSEEKSKRLLNTPANSFFDIFTDLSITRSIPENSTEYFTTPVPIHLQGTARSLINLSGLYSQNKPVLFNPKEYVITANGQTAGTIQLLAVNLNSSKSN